MGDADPSSAVDAFVVSLEGEFDLSESVRLRETFAIVESAPAVIVDFGKTRYIDSTVLRSLVELRRSLLRHGGRLVLAGLEPGVERLFEVSDLQSLFDIRSNVSDAVESLGREHVTTQNLTLVVASSEEEPVP